MFRTLTGIALLATFANSVACIAVNPDGGTTPGGGGGTGGDGVGSATATSSGVPRTLTLGTLTITQASALCDWTNSKQGGYGRKVLCADASSQATSPSQLTCVTITMSPQNPCTVLTVGQIEDCANATGTDICRVETDSACAPVLTCGQ